MLLRPKASQSGFLLVTVVVLLAVVSLMLTQVAILGLREARVAVADEQEVRQRWATTSLRQFCLDGSAGLLDGRSRDDADRDRRSTFHRSSFSAQLRFAGGTWTVLVADESAKLNIRQLAGEHPAAEVAQAASELIPTAARARLRRFVDWPASPTDGGGRIEAWVAAAGGHELGRSMASATPRVTIWGSGRLNLRRADDETVDALWRILFGRAAPGELHELRRADPPLSWDEIRTRLALRESQAETANRWFSDSSGAASVWIFSDSDRRIPGYLFVTWADRGRRPEHRGAVY